jgi:hypothetical protein
MSQGDPSQAGAAVPAAKKPQTIHIGRRSF